MTSSGLVLRTGLAALIAVTCVRASAAEPSHELARTGTTFMLTETGASLALLVGATLFPVPKQCRWCDSNAFDRAGHDALLMSNPKSAAAVSHVFSFGVVPATAIGAVSVAPLLRDQSSDALANTAILLNVLMVDVALTATAKFNVARRRPAFYYGRQADTEYASSTTEQNVSFFSGDTSVAFSLAAASSTVAFLRGYEYAPYLAVGSGLAASTVGVLRVSANVHWPSDVLTGAFVGTAVGIGLPLLLHPRVHPADSSPAAGAGAPLRSAPPQLQLTMLW